MVLVGDLLPPASYLPRQLGEAAAQVIFFIGRIRKLTHDRGIAGIGGGDLRLQRPFESRLLARAGRRRGGKVLHIGRQLLALGAVRGELAVDRSDRGDMPLHVDDGLHLLPLGDQQRQLLVVEPRQDAVVEIGFLLPVRVLSRLFRRLFLTALAEAHAAGRLRFFGEIEGLCRRKAFVRPPAPLRGKNWFVHAKPPLARPEAVLAYLARYTHRVAIANSRLTALDERGVTFRYKDYRRDGQARYRTMTLSADEFIRRFLLHLLPKGFHRIRHYGLLASAACKANIACARELITAPTPAEVAPPATNGTADPVAPPDHRPPCPCCGGRMLIVEVFGRGSSPRGPPSATASGI